MGVERSVFLCVFLLVFPLEVNNSLLCDVRTSGAVAGFVWAECKQLWEEGIRAYVRQWWNWLDFMMLSLYLATFALRVVAFFQIESGKYGPRRMAREDWPTNDPTLISEGLFAIANVFSFARIIYLFQVSGVLGVVVVVRTIVTMLSIVVVTKVVVVVVAVVVVIVVVINVINVR